MGHDPILKYHLYPSMMIPRIGHVGIPSIHLPSDLHIFVEGPMERWLPIGSSLCPMRWTCIPWCRWAKKNGKRLHSELENHHFSEVNQLYINNIK